MSTQLFINGKGTLDAYGLILTTVSETPPTPKTYTVDIPGGNGVIDLSEYGGDVVYNNQSLEYTFLLAGRTPKAIQTEYTKLAGLWHGKKFDFKKSWDPGYTYTGRFTISEFPNNYNYGKITLKISAEPYKFLTTRTLLINAAGGVIAEITNGRKRVCPTFQVLRTTQINYDGATYTLEPGTYKINTLWLSGGVSNIVINSYPAYSYATWEYYAGKTWADYGTELLSVLCAGSQPLQASYIWSALAGKTWWDLTGKTWMNLTHDANLGDEYGVYMQYGIYDL